jgi:molybdopterin synthase sulfur carrier subunit
MPSVTVRTMFDLARIIGRPAVPLDVAPGATVRTVLEALVAAYDGLQGRLFDAQTGGLMNYLFVEMNGRDIRSLQGLETPVRDGDALAILIPVAGGAPGSIRQGSGL